jgi:anaerobic magnesium-protoporphyrin IX monomethyl ester cyclase
MRVLLFSMPDSFEHTPSLTMRMPNGALASLAGNVDAHHKVAIADLVLVQSRVKVTVERLVRELAPDVVGLSVMTFQRRTALELVRVIRRLKPDVRFVAGGYDPSLAPEAYADPDSGIDYLIRGEGDLTFRDLLRSLERGGGDVATIPGLSVRESGGFRHNPPRPVNRLDDGVIALPNRAARVLDGYTFLGRKIDVV